MEGAHDDVARPRQGYLSLEWQLDNAPCVGTRVECAAARLRAIEVVPRTTKPCRRSEMQSVAGVRR